jgi:hypothetical protein
MVLKQVIKILNKKPQTFKDCVFYARKKFEKFFSHDIQQLLHVYPLTSKTKDGNPFWTLPKRPPTPIVFNPEDPLHCLFISSMACLRATIFKIPIPSELPRSEVFRKELGEMASNFEMSKFVPNDEKAKEIQASVQKEAKEEEKKEEEQKVEEENKDDSEILKAKY